MLQYLLLFITRKCTIINANVKLMQKYIYSVQSTFTSIDPQPFASKCILWCQQMTINTILQYIRDNKISIRQVISLA